MQSRHNGQTIMIKAAQHQHGGSFLRLTWDPGIILDFNLVQSVDCGVVLALLEDKQSLGKEDCNSPFSRFPCFAVGDNFINLC